MTPKNQIHRIPPFGALTNASSPQFSGRVLPKCESKKRAKVQLMVLPGEHIASVTAISDCEFAVVDKKHFEFMIQQTPYFATHVLEIMAMRIRRTNALLPFLEDC
jgi:CRP-like cAMP-binding protein